MTGCTQPSHGGALAAARCSLQLTFHPSKHDVINNMEALSLTVLIISFLVGRNPRVPICRCARARQRVGSVVLLDSSLHNLALRPSRP